ncbi:MAG: hypothetical protein SO016_09380 [Lachnospiraceae bacterium]|nr:hypothetical protein [Lachnospiraceae bacterium]
MYNNLIKRGAAQNVPDSVQTTKKQLVAFGRAEDLDALIDLIHQRGPDL